MHKEIEKFSFENNIESQSIKDYRFVFIEKEKKGDIFSLILYTDRCLHTSTLFTIESFVMAKLKFRLQPDFVKSAFEWSNIADVDVNPMSIRVSGEHGFARRALPL